MSYDSNNIHKQDFGLRKEKLILKLRLIDTYYLLLLVIITTFIFKIIKVGLSNTTYS